MAVAKAGGMHALARALGIKFQSIQKWKKIPAERVLTIEHITGIPREKLRPDVFIFDTNLLVTTIIEAKSSKSAGSKKKKKR